MKASLQLTDGSTWPTPDLDAENEVTPAWRAIHNPLSLERSDLLHLARISNAYSYLLALPRRQRDAKIRMIREALTQENAA